MSRGNARSRRLRQRPSRIVPATVVALVLLALGVLTAVEAITRLADGVWPAPAARSARAVAALTWGSTAVVTAGAVAALLGLVLLVAALKPGAFQTVRLDPGTTNADVGDTDFVISTRAVARLAASRADQVDGVDRVSAAATGRRVRLRVATSSEETDLIGQQVTQRVSRALAAAGLRPAPRVTTTVHTKGS